MTNDWNALYGQVLATAKLPFTKETRHDVATLTVRDLLVNLDDVAALVAAATETPTLIYVFADVVQLSTTRNWALRDQALVIAARRIEATNGTFLQLDHTGGHTSSSVVVYATEVGGSLTVKVFDDSTPVDGTGAATFDLSTLPSLGAQVGSINGAAVRTDLTGIDPQFLTFGGDLWMSLSNIFMVASLIETSHPAAAGGMATWVQAATSGVPGVMDLYVQSVGLAAEVARSATSVSFVPHLSPAVYQELATAFVTAATAYEQNYQTLSNESAEKARWLDAAAQMQHQVAITGRFDLQLLNQAVHNFTATDDAVRAAEARLTYQQLLADEASEAFKTGLAIWKEEQIIKAVFNIFSAVITFVASIALMAVGDEAAGASAVGAVAEAGEAVADAAAVGGEVASLAAKLSQLASKMATLKNAIEAIEKLSTFVGEIAEASEKIDGMSSADNVRMPGPTDLSTQVEWDAFRLDVDELLQWAIGNQVDGASDYRLQLDKVALYGKALAATQTSLIAAAQELARMRGQSAANAAMQASVDTYVGKLQASIAPDAALLHLFYVRGLNVKRSLYLAATNYVRAYRYWALAESSVQPSLQQDAADLAGSLAQMQQDYASALDQFRPAAPDDFGTSGGATIDHHITDAASLDELRISGRVHVAIDLTAAEFADHSRVRLTKVRAWLFGAVAANQVNVEISSSGSYQDRLGDREYRFTSAPLERDFEYKNAAGDQTGILYDGGVADELEYAYFQPTPFAEWLISVPSARNPGLDLTGLTSLTLSFSGSSILDSGPS